MAPRLERIQLDKGARTLILAWSDGLSSSLPWPFLRANCPSATEKAAREAAARNPLQVITHVPSTELVEVRPVGNYAIGLTWGDGHAVGIYTWEYLRELALKQIATSSK